MKQDYRLSNKRQFQAFTALAYNRRQITDQIAAELDMGRACTQVTEDDELVLTALKEAKRDGKNCMASGLVILPLDLLDYSAAAAEARQCLLERAGKTKKEFLRSLEEGVDGSGRLEGLEEFAHQLGLWLFNLKHGRDPNRGDESLAINMPRPDDDKVTIHRGLAIASGQSLQPCADTKAVWSQPVAVRANPSFHQLPWFSNVEIRGEDCDGREEAWYAKLLILFRYAFK